MGFLNKNAILKAYKGLSKLSADPTLQGATQKVSIIRHFLALDSFFCQFHRNCDTRNKEDRRNFVEKVSRICAVYKDFYSTNFFFPLKESRDCNVGSNFYSAGQVKISLSAPNKVHPYPARGGYKPLFEIQNGVLQRELSMYVNFNDYVTSASEKVALIVWLLRETDIPSNSDKILDNIKEALSNLYSTDLISTLIADENQTNTELLGYDLNLSENFYSIREEDINELFATKETKFPNSEICDKKYASYFTALRTKPFMLLAGISGTGKSRIVRKLAQATVTEELQRSERYNGTDFANDRWKLHSPANFELIQVKPNWHNSMDVIGYQSNIPSPHYVFTPFIEFIVKAWQHPDVPFFLCLDEMNLAPVEEYFAEFLSAIESRSFEDGEYMTDPIIKPFNLFGTMKNEKGEKIDVGGLMVNTLFPNFKASDTDSETAHIIKHFRTKGLTLPKNLIVIGTVNMDETTFSFSRKVLDRAMSVEMNEVDYDSFLTGNTDDDLKTIVKAFEDGKYGEDTTLNSLLVDRHIEAKEVVDDLGEDARFVIDYLKRINALLEGTPFKLGYRAANEALIYLQSSREFGQGNSITALDNFTLMKILSRIEGDETKLKITNSEADKERITNAGVNVDEAKIYGDLNILTAMRNIITQQLGGCYDANREDYSAENAEQEESIGISAVQPKNEKLQSIKKIDNMLSQLRRDHFVSYWN